jgi:hypothetical protein
MVCAPVVECPLIGRYDIKSDRKQPAPNAGAGVPKGAALEHGTYSGRNSANKGASVPMDGGNVQRLWNFYKAGISAGRWLNIHGAE